MKSLLTSLVLILSLSANSQITSFIKHGDTVFCYFPLTRDSIRVNYSSSSVGNVNWGNIGGTLSSQADLVTFINSYLTTATAAATYAPIASPTFTGTVGGITSSMVGLGNVTNESKATMFTSPTFTGTVGGVTAAMVGLGNVTNESKATMFTSPTFTGTVSGITSTMVGLGNVNNTSDASKPVSTATQTALNLKQDISGNQGGWTTVRVSGSNATTTGQSLVDITGLVSGTLSNSTMYEIEAVLDVTTSAVTTGTEYGIGAGGTGGAAVVSVVLTGTTTGTSGSTEVLSRTAGTASTARLLTSGQSGTIILKGFVTTRGSGTATISVTHLKVTSGTSTVNIGSVFRYRIAQ